MHDMTAANLRSAYGGESMAHMRYIAWGDRAARDGFPNVSRLFSAISYAEQIHATNHFRELRSEAGAFDVTSAAGFGLGSTSENLAGAIEGEEFEIKEMYSVYLNAAEFQKETGAQRSFNYALETEKVHAAMYRKAKQSVDNGSDIELGPVQICEVCGYTLEGDAPDRCPICNAVKDKFREFA